MPATGRSNGGWKASIRAMLGPEATATAPMADLTRPHERGQGLRGDAGAGRVGDVFGQRLVAAEEEGRSGAERPPAFWSPTF
jgi:hypothetical protein